MARGQFSSRSPTSATFVGGRAFFPLEDQVFQNKRTSQCSQCLLPKTDKLAFQEKQTHKSVCSQGICPPRPKSAQPLPGTRAPCWWDFGSPVSQFPSLNKRRSHRPAECQEDAETLDFSQDPQNSTGSVAAIIARTAPRSELPEKKSGSIRRPGGWGGERKMRVGPRDSTCYWREASC